MPKLPQVKPSQMQRLLTKTGFVLICSKGSHFRYKHPDGRMVTVAFHNRSLKRGTLKSILQQADITIDEFLKLL